MRDVIGVFASLSLVCVRAFAAQSADMGHAQHHHAMSEMPVHRAPIEISINPEARVSVALGAPMPAHNVCGGPITLPVRIINDSFITASLEARLVGNVPSGVKVNFNPAPLTGQSEERRQITITLAEPGTKDLTISFKAHNDIPDLGGRDRVHFLMKCEAPAAGTRLGRRK